MQLAFLLLLANIRIALEYRPLNYTQFVYVNVYLSDL